MSKMKKSVKVLLISLVAVVCVLAIVLGCIFGLKKDNASGFTTAQKQLANEINSNSTYLDKTILENVPYENFCEYDKVKQFGKNYFVYEDANSNENFIVFKQNEDGTYLARNLTEQVSTESDAQGGFILENSLSYSVNTVYEDYVVLVSEFSEQNLTDPINNVYTLVYFGDFDNIKEIYTFDTRGKNLYIFESFNIKDRYFSFSTYSNIDYSDGSPKADVNVYFYELSTEKIDPNDNTGLNMISGIKFGADYNCNFAFFDDSFYYSDSNGLKLVYLTDDGFSVFEKETVINSDNGAVKTDYSVNFLTEGKYLIDYNTYVFDKNEITSTTISNDNDILVNHSYTIFDYTTKNPTEQKFNLKSGYGLASTISTSTLKLTNSYYIAQQKVGENYSLLNDYYIAYYDNNSNETISYSSNSKEYITYAGSSTFLTNSRLLKVENGKVKTLYDFTEKDNYSLNGTASSSVFSIKKDSYLGLMNIDGKVVVSPEFFTDNMNIVNHNGVAIATDGENYYKIDVETGKYSIIEDFVDSSDIAVLLTQKADIYFVNSGEKFDLVDIKGNTLLQNIDEFKFLNLNVGAGIELTQGENSYFITFEDVKVSQTKSEEKTSFTFSAYNKSNDTSNSSEISPYYYDYWTFTNARVDCAKGWNPVLTITMKNSRYVTDFECDFKTQGGLGSIDCILRIYSTTFNNDGSVSVSWSGNNVSEGFTASYMSDGNLQYRCVLSFWNLLHYGAHLPEDSDQISLSTSTKYHYYYFRYDSSDYDPNTTNYPRYQSATYRSGSFPMASGVTLYYADYTPTVSNANFSAWYYDTDDSRSYSDFSSSTHINTLTYGGSSGSISLVKNNYFRTTFYSKFTPKSYTITYDRNGNDGTSGTSTQSVTYKSSFTTKSSSTFSNTGYTFVKWNTRSNGNGTSYSASSSYTYTTGGNLTLYAIWEPIKYYVEFDLNDGIFTSTNLEKFSPTLTTANQSIGHISGTYFYKTNSTPAYGAIYLSFNGKSGFILVSTSASGVYYYTDDTTVNTYGGTFISNGTTYYYNSTTGWVDTGSSISYNSGYLPSYSNLSVSTVARKLVENIYIATFDSWFNILIPTKVGYTFNGWSFSTTISGGHTITKNYGTSTSSYNSTTSNSFKTGPNDIYFRNMYGSIYNYDQTTFSATWTANEYDIEYELGGGSLSSKPLSATYDEWFQVPNPTRTGYTFSGWTISGMTSGVTHYFGTTTSSYRTSTGTSYTTASASYKYFKNLGTTDGQEITFTAVWDSKPYYISYSLNASGASLGANSPTTVYYDSWFQVSNPTRTGYTFTGWTITNMTSGLTHRFGTSTSSYATSTSSSYTNSSTSRTYYYNLHSGYGTVNFSAGWSVNTYYIEYEEGDGTLGTSKPGSAKFDSWFNISAPSSVPVGYYYDGWIVSDASTDCTHYYGTSNSSYSTTRASTFNVGTNQLYFQNLHSQNGATVTLTINWHPYTYNIGYNLNGGEHGQYHPTTAEYDADVTISNPTRAGYTFTGWSFSGLNDECTHYFYYGSSWVAFTSTNGRYTDEVNVNYDRIVNATRFRNLGIEGGALVLTANWSANYYNITYHFLPASYDIVDDSIDTINTAGNMTATKTQQVRYDFNFKAYVSSVNALNSNEIELPQGVKLLFWVVNNTGSTYSSTTNLVSWNGDNTVATPISGKSVNAGQEETYSSENGYAPRDIHVYAAYTFVDITIQYMVASGEDWRNDLSNYSTYSTDTTTYNSNYHLLNILSSGINGWLITPNHYDFGTLTEDSITTYTFDGTYYEATVGSDIFWIFSNTSAYDSENPVYYAYAVYYGKGTNGYYITFESDDFDLSSLGYEDLWVTYDEWVNIPKPTRTGINFVGWSITGMDNELHLYGTSQSSYQTTSATTLSTSATYFKNLRGDFAETVNFEAVWQRAEYKISYSLDGGTHGSSHPTTVVYDNWFNVSIPTKTGYSFSGWTISGMTSGTTHYFGTSTSSYVTSTGTSYSTNSSYTWFRYLNSNAGTVTFTARWSINTYKISYSLGGGSYGTYHPTSATFNSWFQVSSPTRTGYTFNGWTISGMTNGLTHRFGTSTSSYVTSTGTSYTNSTTSRTYYYNLGSNSGQTVTFTASWIKDDILIQYNLNGGQFTTSYPEYVSSTGETFIPTPVKEDYVFSGWLITGINRGLSYSYDGSVFYRMDGTGFFTSSPLIQYFGDIDSDSGMVGFTACWELDNGMSFVVTDDMIDDRNTRYETPDGFVFENNTLIEYVGDSKDIIIPASYFDIYPVLYIREGVFSGMDFIESVQIPDTVLEIREAAFYDCVNLLDVKFSYNLKVIGSHAFANVPIVKLNLPNNLKYIGISAFEQSYINELNLNNGLMYIDERAFMDNCFNIIDIPETCTHVKNGAFGNNSFVTDIYIRSSVFINERIVNAFNSDSFNGVWVDEGYIREYRNSSNWSRFSEYIISLDNLQDNNNVTVTDDYGFVFSQNTLIEASYAGSIITIPSTYVNNGIEYPVLYIGERAFRNLPVESVYMPDSILRIEREAFYRCENLKYVEFSSKLQYIGARAFMNCSQLEEIILPNDLLQIDEEAFCNCELSNVIFNQNIQIIGLAAFESNNLQMVDIPASCQIIGNGAFCNNPIRLVIVRGLTYIAGGNDMFIWQSIEAVYASELIINDLKYYNYWDEIDESLYIPLEYYVDFQGSEITDSDGFVFMNNKLIAYTGGDSIIQIPMFYNDGNMLYPVLYIDDHAFDGIYLDEIIMPNTITRIGFSAFSNCDCRTLVLSKNLKFIDDEAFINNSQLIIDKIIPYSVVKIGSYAFSGCSIEGSIQIYGELKQLGDGAFTSLNIEQTGDNADTIYIVDLPTNLLFIYGTPFDSRISVLFLRCKSIPITEIPEFIYAEQMFVPDDLYEMYMSGDYLYTVCENLIIIPNGM